MTRYSLRTLLILLAIGPPMLAGAWWGYQREVERRRRTDFDRLIELIEKAVKPTPWDEVGGLESIDDFTDKLDIIVGSGQVVHEQPASNE